MHRTLATTLGLATLLLASCTGAPSPTPTPTARIVSFTASAERTPRNVPVTLLWQAEDAGVQDGQFSCIVTRRIGDDPFETQLQAACAGGLTEVVPAPVTATTVHYDFKVLKQPADANEPYLTATRSIVLDPALYATRAGGTGADRAWSVSALPDGSAIIAGSFAGTATFGAITLTGAGSDDIFVARADPDGRWVWATRAGGSGADEAYAVSALPDGGAVIAGYFSGSATFGASGFTTTLTSAGGSDVFVARIDPNGAWTQATRAGGTGADRANVVSLLPDGSALVAGFFSGTTVFGATALISAGNHDAFVARIRSDGVWSWARRIGDTGWDGAESASVLPDGSAIIIGFFSGTATFGTTNLTSAAGSQDVFVARIDAGGNWAWANRAGGTNTDIAQGVSTLPDGSAIVAGAFYGTAAFGSTTLTSAGSADAFVARIDAGGTWTWANRAGGTDIGDSSRSVATLPDGGAIVAGTFYGTAAFGSTTLTSAGSTDVFVARIDANGNWTWAQRAGGSGFEDATGVTALADGGAVVVGYFPGNTTFGTTTLTSAGGHDVFVARIGANGAW